MANVLVEETYLKDIADAIRSKKGVSTTYKPSDMPSAIESISGGGVTPTGTINITTNGTHDVTNYASASVAVPQGTTPTGTINIATNGTHDVTNYALANVAVPTGSIENYGSKNSYTISELFDALTNETYSTGTFTCSAYYTANTETMLFDTGFSGTVGGILIFDLENPSVVNATNSLNIGLGFFIANNSTADQTEASRGVWKAAATSGSKMFNANIMNSYRVNSGKLYINPKYATLANSHFMIGHTYRWIAWSGGNR